MSSWHVELIVRRHFTGYGEEAMDNARVWKLYRDRVTERDEDQIASWHSTLDILLIFVRASVSSYLPLTASQAGLFSAVATAFIIESCVRVLGPCSTIDEDARYQQLQPDYTKLLAQAFIASLNRMEGNSPLAGIPSLDDFQRPRLARGINALWFLSLALALTVALLAILAKKWLGEYTSRMRRHVGSQRRWAWRHFAYFAGLESWGMDSFISALPPLLHISLLLFLTGLVAFLTDLDWVIASLILALTLTVVVLYVGTTLAPLWYGDCPFATPLLPLGRRLLEWVHVAAYSVMVNIHRGLRTRLRLQWTEWTPKGNPWRRPAYDESILLQGDEEARDEKVLGWMASSLPNVDEVNTALDAIGSLDALTHQLAHHSHTDGQYTYFPENDPLCTMYVKNAAVARFRRLSDSGMTTDPLAVAHCLRTLIVLDLKLPRFAGQSLISTFRETLHQWRLMATYDINVLSGVILELDQVSEVADDLSFWDTDARNASGTLPYHASSLVLSLLELYRSPSQWKWGDVGRIFCHLAQPLTSPTMDKRQRRAAYALIAFAIDPARASKPELAYISTSQQVQVRALRLFQDLTLLDVEGIPHDFKQLAVIKFESACLAWQNVATLEITAVSKSGCAGPCRIHARAANLSAYRLDDFFTSCDENYTVRTGNFGAMH